MDITHSCSGCPIPRLGGLPQTPVLKQCRLGPKNKSLDLGTKS
ncbi:Hypothetical protein RAK1035_2019 [Roseovarius sp. AK1035]|nr:Hypothetical protein RAK1035_2019 [Roseovarius sp. AK1035]